MFVIPCSSAFDITVLFTIINNGHAVVVVGFLKMSVTSS